MHAAIGLGSNLGDRRLHLDNAVAALDGVVAVSRYVETDPVGGPPQGRYLNAAAIVETDATPRELLARCRALEEAAGRTREERWGPRTLDLDLLLYGDRVVADDDLVVPHPRLAERAFVLGPLAEVAAHWVVPGLDRTVGELFEDL